MTERNQNASGVIIIDPPTAQVIIDDREEPECGPIRIGYERTLYTTPEGSNHCWL
jgi:hypothetical protein